MIVSHPVERFLKRFPVQLVVRTTLGVPPVPIFRVVPRKAASSVLALVIRVFSSTPLELEGVSQEDFDFLFNGLREAFAPAHANYPVICVA